MTEVEMQIHRQTDRAIHASNTGDEEDAVWLPLSLVEVTPKTGHASVTVTMPEWLAKREGLI